MAVAGTSRPCSGACHEISHAIDMVLPEKSAPHGEQVAVGALFATYLRGANAEFNQLHDALFRHGLPTSPKDLGLSTEQFAQAVAFAPQTRPDRFTILEHKNLDEAELMRVVSDFVAAL
jgi:glycerol-1-phosphate dehydrogenase [NAD(P)+]